MIDIYNFRISPSLEYCIRKLKRKYPYEKIDKMLTDVKLLIMQNPETGEKIKGAPEIFQGRVYKKYVGGRTKYRLIYIVSNPTMEVLAVYLSTVKRDKFNYIIPWGKILEMNKPPLA